ncbi:MAG TPA: Ig-like domain-containing protein [Candidatus Limnocylindrales bacterium]
MIDHDRALELAAAAIDFGLSSADDAALAEHLEGCESCRTTVSLLRNDAAALRALDTIEAPDGLRERVMEATAGPAIAASAPQDAPQRGTILRFPARIPPVAAIATAAVMVLAVVGGTLFWRPAAPDGVAVVDPSDRPSPTSASADPGTSSGPSSQPSDTPPAQPRLAHITADEEIGGVVPLDTSFELASIDGSPAEDLAARVRVQPHIELTSTVEPDGRVRLTPVVPLTSGVVYRFELTTPDGATTDSWAFQAKQPVRVVTTVPYDSATDVPVDTGIEVTFDQDGVVGAEDHFSIEPRVAGRFEQHGRVLSFVPNRLQPRTIYTVTISRGVTVERTGETLDREVRFRFETSGQGARPNARSYFQFSNDLFESATRDRPVVGLWWFDVDGRPSTPRTVRLDVYRYADRDAAIDAFVALRELPRWSEWNASERLPTRGLTRVARVDAPLREAGGTLFTTLPERLAAGWYLIQHPDDRAPAQTILQVTDVTAYLAVSERKSVLWANDAATGKPLSATVAAGGATLGTTDDQGLLAVDSPTAWRPREDECVDDCTPIVTVTAGRRSAFLPATGIPETSFDVWTGSADTRYWLLFETDRAKYRRTDTVDVWGMVRERDTGTVPADVEIRLRLEAEDSGVPITLAQSKPRATGAFTASLPLEDVAEGGYQLELTVGGNVLASRYIEVERIIKPAYRLDITTGRRVYVAGDRIRATATATFFEGTPVPGVPVRFEGDVSGSATTDASGTAIVRGVARWPSDESREGRREGEIAAFPARAEERADISANRGFVIFPSHWLLEGAAKVQGRRLSITGTAAELARDRVERAIADGAVPWEVDALGQGLTGKTVRARVIEYVPVRTRTGTSYDFVEKRTIPVYDYTDRERVLGTFRLRTRAGGAFSGSIAIKNVRHSYSVELSITDTDGLRSTIFVYAYGADTLDNENQSPFVAATKVPPGGYSTSAEVGVRDPIDIRMFEPGASGSPRDDRHLFIAAQGGIREATVQSSDRFVTRFPDWGPPNVAYLGVRFTGRGYVAASPFSAAFRVADRSIKVTVTPDRSRYAPNTTAKLAITTTGADGRPVPATVVIRAIDEKLYDIGAAVDVDHVRSLYEHVSAGILAYYATHHRPSSLSEGGDTGGGGDAPVNDQILFQAIDTDADGRASVAMPLPADLTSWHVSASAVGGDLQAGGATIMIPVGLPFFVDASIAPEYLASDRPTIQVRGFGSALGPESQVTFSVDSETLDLHERGLTSRAFRAISVPLPKLSAGTHVLTITAQSGRGPSLLRHVLKRSFVVVPSRLARTRTTYVESTSAITPDGGGDLTEVIVADAGVGRVLPLLHELAGRAGTRMETALSADLAADVLIERFDADPARFDAGGFIGSSYQREDGGIAIVPYAAGDVEATVLAALVAPERFRLAPLRGFLRQVATDPSETRERRNLALAGLAGTDEPVLPAVREALATGDLTIRERLILGIGAARLGDTATARAVASDLEARHGEHVGSAARLRVGADGLDASTAAALMAMLLAAYGDPSASMYHAYVAGNAVDPRTFALHDAAYARWTVDHAVTSQARFAYILDGKRSEVSLGPGMIFRTVVSKALRPGFSIEPISGRIGVTTTWREAVDASLIVDDPDLRLSRTVRPSGTIGQGSLVRVELQVTFGPQAPRTCHRVVDLVPSGLLPIAMPPYSIDEATGDTRRNTTAPETVVGQRVIFCVAPSSRSRTVTLRYFARVVSIGSYRWEPALAESRSAADRAAVVPARNVRIR